MIIRQKINSTRTIWLFFALSIFLVSFTSPKLFASALSDSGLYVIPYPQKVEISGNNFDFNSTLNIVLDKNHSSAEDVFTANELIRDLKNEWGISASISNKMQGYSIVLDRKRKDSQFEAQGYQLLVSKNQIIITASGEEGLFYGTQTLLQLIQKNGSGHKVIGLRIEDWPDIKERAIHYDTKHHQDKLSYVKSFIKDLSRYKINILVWEWEDKFAYPSHPEIGAPGAFTPKEIQGLTDYARLYHIQIVPLVQGLGHASFILKWPQFAHLREIPASNFEFCPLKEGTYDLLFDLWKDAMNATKGSKYIHIGSDETFELGLGEQCKIKEQQIGKKGLYYLFANKAAKYIASQGRMPMIWDTPMGWTRDNPGDVLPSKSLVLTEDMGEVGVNRAEEAKKLGYEVFSYVPNPGIEPLFLPYFFRETSDGEKITGCLENSYNTLKEAAISGAFDGMIRTSWDDSGLHNQMWMMSFLNAAEFSWNGNSPGLEEFVNTFFKSYYGINTVEMEKLFYLLNEGTYYYWNIFERKVWAFGNIGKTFLPDLPRGDALEYDPYWSKQHKELLNLSFPELKKMDSALSIIKKNKALADKHLYDFEIFESIAKLIRENSQTYIDLSKIENAIKEAHNQTFLNRDSAYLSLQKAQQIIENNLKERSIVFNNLVEIWDETRLPKGMSTHEKKYFYQQDRTRHFANRRPDMTYLIYDEQKLGLEEYLEKLQTYMVKYKNGSF